MSLYLRQICLVADPLGPVMADLEAVFGTPVCHVDSGVEKFGLENALMAFGTQFLEVVAPIQDGTAAGRYLQRRGGDGGYMVITQVQDKADQEIVRRNAAANDVRVAYDSDRGHWHLMQLHPGDMRAAFLEVEWDDVGDVTGHWNPAGGTEWLAHVLPDPAHSPVIANAIACAELQGEDPDALAAHWAAVSGHPVQVRDGIPHIALANAELRFVPATDGRGPGLGGLDIICRDAERAIAAAKSRGLPTQDNQILICGTRFNLIG